MHVKKIQQIKILLIRQKKRKIAKQNEGSLQSRMKKAYRAEWKEV